MTSTKRDDHKLCTIYQQLGGIFQNHFQNVGYLDKINSTIYQ